jgi:transposase
VITAHTPKLLNRYGVGPDTAAALLVAAGDNPDRFHHEAAFAALCGVSPLEASSGKTQRPASTAAATGKPTPRSNTIVLARLRWDPRTRAYVDRRLAEGKTRREAIRCLKRYVARELYQVITQPQLQPHTVPSAA